MQGLISCKPYCSWLFIGFEALPAALAFMSMVVSVNLKCYLQHRKWVLAEIKQTQRCFE